MANKNVYFYELKITDNFNNEIAYNEIKPIYSNIFENYYNNNNLILDDTPSNKINMEIIIDNNNYLFCKIGKIKDNNTMQFRNFEDFSTEPVISIEEFERKGVEIYTYFLLDYRDGIISIVKGQSAPNENTINNIINRYLPDFKSEINPIVSLDTYVKLYEPASRLNSFSLTLHNPNEQILQAILGDCQRETLADLIATGKRKVTFEVSAVNSRVGLTNDNEEIHECVQPLVDSMTTQAELIFKGSSGGQSTQEYKAGQTKLKHVNNINTYRQENYLKIPYTQRELNDEFFNAIQYAYIATRIEILSILNRL